MVQDTNQQQVVTLCRLAGLLAIKYLVQSRAIAAEQGVAMFMSFLQDAALSFIGPFKTFSWVYEKNSSRFQPKRQKQTKK